MIIRTIDFETDGMPPDARICEIGWCDINAHDPANSTVGIPFGMLVNPNRPMPPAARAIHHIGDADLVDAADIDTGFKSLIAGQPTIYCAHNAAFEKNFFTGGENAAWICTLKVGRRLWPDCPSHSNQCLRYYLNLDLPDALAMPPHRAAPDAFVTAHILIEALKSATTEQMIIWTSEPSLLPGKVGFGKHKDLLWSQCPPDYLEWIARQPDMDSDKVHTAKHWLDRRRCDAR